MNSTTTSKKHRSVPIKETMTHITGYPNKLVLFKIAASPYWQVRYYAQRIIKKSTKTEVKRDAIDFAKNWHAEVIAKIHKNLPIGSSPTFEKCANELIAEQEALIARKQLNAKLNINDRSILKSINEHFGRMDIRKVTYGDINTYLAKLATKKINKGTDAERKISSATIKKHSILISKILKYAHRERLLDRLPTIPTTRVKDTPRGWFDHHEYIKLRKVLAEVATQTVKVRNHFITDELRLLSTFMVNTFLRPSDLKNLRHRNIQINEQRHKYLQIITETAKTENTPIASMPDAVDIYRDILERNEGWKKDDFVFFPKMLNRQFAMETMRRQFDKVLQIAELKKSPSGEQRTLYSLRHTAIMFRLLKGNVDLLTLARACRTSVEIIDRFYGRHLNSVMNIAKLQSRSADAYDVEEVKADTHKPKRVVRMKSSKTTSKKSVRK